MATRRDRPLSAGRPISQRWREWQPEWRGNLDDVSPGLFERGGDAYRWGLYGAGRLTPRVVRGQYVDPAIRGCFERYDRNRSGRLDYRELRAALQALGVDVSRAEAADVLGAYDADGSGLMEIDEFARLVYRLGYLPLDTRPAARDFYYFAPSTYQARRRPPSGPRFAPPRPSASSWRFLFCLARARPRPPPASPGPAPPVTSGL